MSSIAASPVAAASPRALPTARALRLAGVAAQLGLALLVVRAFRLESRTFYGVVLLAAAGFVPHALLAPRWRLPAFTLLSATALAFVVGVRDALALCLAGVALVAICHLPVRLAARVALLLAAGAALAAARIGMLPAPWSGGVWAVFGSIFMFRLALYLHAVRHEPVRPTPMQAAAYFLMLPNPVFPLFPLVDFSAFVRTHYADGADELETYQTGVAWIARGLVHLLLYRLVYQTLPPDPLRLATLSDLTWYVLGTFLLYLRVSGQFHVIVGMLRLYGFALPETHRLFFLASSFTDFWRRINIYWKDFMMKLVYYPSFFRLRRFGGTVALVVATMAVFAATWALHAYQWFWILGGVLLSLPDLLFWAILGGLVVATSLREARRGRDRSLGARRWSWRLAARTVATFAALCALWSLWSAESVFEWLWMWRSATRVDGTGIALLAVGLVVGGAIAGRNWTAPQRLGGAPATTAVWRRADARTALTLVALLALSRPELGAVLGPAAPLVAALHRTTLSLADAAVERRGYYERLDRAPRLGAMGWEAQARRPADWAPFFATPGWRDRDDFLVFDLQPGARFRWIGTSVTINALGMRDAPRTVAKPAGTTRLAVLGPSYVMGSLVDDGVPFTAQLERRLAAEVAPATGRRYEVLNFGRPTYALAQQLGQLDDQVFAFQPDVVVVTVHTDPTNHTYRHLLPVVKRRLAVPYPGLDSLLRRHRVSALLPESEVAGKLRIAADEIHEWTLRRIAEECRRRGIVPVLLGLDLPGAVLRDELPLLRAAERAGFVVLDLFDVYGPAAGHASLQVAPWDKHPNAAGHARIAARLLDELRRRPALLGPPSPSLAPAAPRPALAASPPQP